MEEEEKEKEEEERKGGIGAQITSDGYAPTPEIHDKRRISLGIGGQMTDKITKNIIDIIADRIIDKRLTK